MRYEQIIEKLKKKGSALGLRAIDNLLSELEHPEDKLTIVHIAGTNGKGSVLAFLDSILREGGYRVGRYISPTIHSYEERFQINGCYIEKEKLEHYFCLVEEAIRKIEQRGEATPTLFEVETAIAFLYFLEEKVDFALIETGMGGRLDATNIIKHPALTILSSVSLDHTAVLGDTLEEIAAEKAGIIKKEVPVILAPNPPEVCQVIKKAAQQAGAAVILVGEEEWQVKEETVFGSSFIWKKQEYHIRLLGHHQIDNSMTALLAAWQLHIMHDPKGTLGQETWEKGLQNAQWPGRLELLWDNPLFFRDGAHNPAGAAKLADFLQKHFTNQKIIYIMGVLRDKDYAGMLSYLMPLADRVYVFRPENERGLEAQNLADRIESFDVPAVVCENVGEAMKRAVQDVAREDVLVACGSLSFMEDMEVYL